MLEKAIEIILVIISHIPENCLEIAGTRRPVSYTHLDVYKRQTVHQLTEKSSPIEREFYEFYRTQRGEFTPDGATPMTTTRPTLSSNVKFMNFYPFEDIETISPRPMLFITGENAHSREFSEDAYDWLPNLKNCI